MSDDIDVSLFGQKGGFRLGAELRAPARGVTALFGRSGCGKTTLLRCIAGLERMRGHVRLGEQEWQDEARGTFVPAERRRVGYVFQDAALFPHMNVAANLEYSRRRSRSPRARITVETATRWMGLSQLLQRRPATLSGGERQRVAIARALVSDPVLLLMDEPITALDVAARSTVLGHLERLRGELEIPIIYVTHAIDEVARLADRVAWLDEGRVQGIGSPGEILARLDLGVALGDEAGGLIEAVVRRHDEVYHLTELDSSWGELVVPRVSADPQTVLRLRVRASDISVSLERERRSSILNVLPGRVLDLAKSSPGLMLVRLACPDDESATLLARVTQRSAERLELAPGLELYLRVKSVSVR